MTDPLIGIALAAYKPNIDYFVIQLRSLQRQTYANWFCIIGCDSDLSALRDEPKLFEFFNDPRFTWHQNNANPGATENFISTAQKCIEKGARFLAFSDQDDEWFTNKLRKLYEKISTLPPLSLVHSDMFILQKEIDSADERFVVLSKTAWVTEKRGIHHVSSSDLMIRNVVAGAGTLMDAELAKRFPQTNAKAFGHDHWFPLVASFLGGVYALNEPLYNYRIHGHNVAGITAYRGFFASSASARQLGFQIKCLMAANGSRERFRFAREVGLPVTIYQRLLTTLPDLGVTYFLKAVGSGSDRALARACLSRAIGKLLRMIYPRVHGYYDR